MTGIRKSTAVTSGRIPEFLHIVCRNYRMEKGYKDQLKPRQVRDAFVVDAARPQSLRTALSWGKGLSFSTGDPAIIRNVPNKPIPRLTLVDADARGEGGRALKVIVPLGGEEGDILVDLREDVLYDLLFFKDQALTRNEDGELRLMGPFQWGYLGSAMRLFWTGSELFQNLMVANVRRTLTKLGPDDLLRIYK